MFSCINVSIGWCKELSTNSCLKAIPSFSCRDSNTNYCKDISNEINLCVSNDSNSYCTQISNTLCKNNINLKCTIMSLDMCRNKIDNNYCFYLKNDIISCLDSSNG